MKKIFCIIVTTITFIGFSAQSAVTVEKSVRPVEGTKTIKIDGLAAKKIYESLSQIAEEPVVGVKDEWMRQSSNIQCIKQKKPSTKFSCYFDISNSGTILSPQFD